MTTATLIDVPILGTSTTTPDWVAKRGGDVRAYDLRSARNVYGPGHHFAVEQDIRITNGLLRADCCARNVYPFVTVSVYKGGAWRSMGQLLFSDVNTLSAARLSAVKPDWLSLVLTVRNEGNVTLRLRRGERMLRVTHGSTRAPTVSVTRLIAWRAASIVPPSSGQGWGDGNWGDGNWGGTYVASGEVNGSPITDGLMYESTADGGATRYTDANGLTRALSTLRAGASKGSGLSMYRGTLPPVPFADFAAFVATANSGDDLSDYQRQSAASSEQEVRVR